MRRKIRTHIAYFNIALKNIIIVDTLTARLVGNPDTKKVRKPRAKRALTPEEKAAFHARMVAAKLAKEKSHNASKK